MRRVSSARRGPKRRPRDLGATHHARASSAELRVGNETTDTWPPVPPRAGQARTRQSHRPTPSAPRHPRRTSRTAPPRGRFLPASRRADALHLGTSQLKSAFSSLLIFKQPSCVTSACSFHACHIAIPRGRMNQKEKSLDERPSRLGISRAIPCREGAVAAPPRCLERDASCPPSRSRCQRRCCTGPPGRSQRVAGS